tara:strand:+ start:6417 stop:6950 length:534 start_codon:yes stop_codon:yes gene_type:complete
VNKNVTRRKFIKGTSVTAIVAAVPSKATWAAGYGCSVSGHLSGNLSRPCDTTEFYGDSPGIWGQRFNNTNNPHNGDLPVNVTFDTKWSDIFDETGQNPFSGVPASTKIREFLPPSGSYKNKTIDKYLVAAYLNAADGNFPLAAGVTAQSYAKGLWELCAAGESAEVQEALSAIWDDS